MRKVLCPASSGARRRPLFAGAAAHARSAAAMADDASRPPATDMMRQITWFEHYTLWFIVPITLLVLVLLAYCIFKFRASVNPVAVADQPQHADRGDLDGRTGRRPAVPGDPVVPAADRAVHAAGRAQADASRRPATSGTGTTNTRSSSRFPSIRAILADADRAAAGKDRSRGLSAPARRRQRAGRAGQHHDPRAGHRRPT